MALSNRESRVLVGGGFMLEASPEHKTLSEGRRAAWGLFANCCAVFMIVLDCLIVNVALASMQKALGGRLADLQWVVDGYTLSFASCLLMAGALGDRLGYRRMFSAGLWIFTLASLGCGLAPRLEVLVAARVLQGMGAAMLIPNALSLLNHSYQEPKAKARAVSIWACCSSAAVSAGPVVGGLLVSAFGWRSIFFVNLPIGLAAYLVLRRSVQEPHREAVQSAFDWIGQLLAIGALASLTYSVIEFQACGWRGLQIPAAFFLMCAAGFSLRQRVSERPLVPIQLLRVPAWVNANLVATFTCFGYYGFIFIASLYFQGFRHFSPLVAGLTFLPMTLLQPFLHPLMGRWVSKVGPRIPLFLSTLVAALGLFLAIFMDEGTGHVWLGLIMLPIGVGSSLANSPAIISMLHATPREYSGLASGLYNTGRQVGSVLGVAILGAWMGAADGSRFLHGFHDAVILAGAVMLLGSLGTLVLAQRGSFHADDADREAMEAEV